MIEFVIEQLAMSTADDEVNYFTGQLSPNEQREVHPVLAPGVYRVIDGQLFRIVSGVAPVVHEQKANLVVPNR